MALISSDWSLWGMFLSAFLSSTLLPGGSEAVLVLLAAKGAGDKLLLLAVATLGNTLGGMSSWLLGRIIAWRFPARRFAAKEQRAIARIRRWGSPVLLLSWLPVVGDPLCLAAGWLRIYWLPSLGFIAAGKAARYAVLLLLA
ncbi:MAG: DedA family protein [Gammaproteobacteria bacterium]|jgi:membrane protein YqaA with SNARE-associated domain